MNSRELYLAGKKWLEDHKKPGYCPKCGKPLPKGRRVWCSDECYEWWWNTFAWNHIRERILERDNHKCRICGRGPNDGRPISVHHIIPWVVSKDNTEDNLITVCERCHARLHRKKNWKALIDAQKCKKLVEA